jgi:hypothetical protein
MAAIGLGLLGACTSGPDSPAPGTRPSGASQAAGTPTEGATTTKGTTTPSAKGAVKDLAGFRCKADSKGLWSATGQLTNSDSAVGHYTLVVSVYSTKTSTVSSEATRTFDLKPKQKTAFSIDKVAQANGKDLDCTAQVTKAKS